MKKPGPARARLILLKNPSFVFLSRLPSIWPFPVTCYGRSEQGLLVAVLHRSREATGGQGTVEASSGDRDRYAEYEVRRFRRLAPSTGLGAAGHSHPSLGGGRERRAGGRGSREAETESPTPRHSRARRTETQ